MARLRKRTIFGIIFVFLIVLMAGGYFVTRSDNEGTADAADSTADSTAVAENGEGEKDKKKEPDPVLVEVAKVTARQISSYYYTTATIDPEKKVEVLSKIAGEVKSIEAEEGDVVKAGQLLCRLEEGEQRVALDEARINLQQQQREFDRIKEMSDQNIISDKEFSDAKAQYELAKNKFDAAKLRYEYTQIKAPFDGIVTKRYVDFGQHINVAAQLFEVVDTDPLLVRMYLPEHEVYNVEVGQEVYIHPDNDPDRMLTGRVIRIAPEVDQRTGTVKVTAETTGHAMPGSFARIKVVTDTRMGSLTIPRRGLVSDAGDLFVYIAEADTVRRSSVKVGFQDEDYAELFDGVAEGDSVVVIGVGGLRTGTKIKVVEPRMQKELSRKDSTEETASN